MRCCMHAQQLFVRGLRRIDMAQQIGEPARNEAVLDSRYPAGAFGVPGTGVVPETGVVADDGCSQRGYPL